MIYRDPNIYRLPIHLENEQTLRYQQGQEVAAIAQANQTQTELMAYFNQIHMESITPLNINELGVGTNGNRNPAGNQVTYVDFPTYYAWDSTRHLWKRRSRPHKADTVGRVYSVHPNQEDIFYLRILLHTRVGATSFRSLRTVDEQIFPTFREACASLNLLADDEEWKQTLREAAITMFPLSLYESYSYIYCLIVRYPVQLIYRIFNFIMNKDDYVTQWPMIIVFSELMRISTTTSTQTIMLPKPYI